MDIGAVLRILLDKKFPERFQIIKVSGEWDSNVIDFIFQSEFYNVVLIVFVDCWKGDRNAWQAHVFLLAQFSFI